MPKKNLEGYPTKQQAVLVFSLCIISIVVRSFAVTNCFTENPFNGKHHPGDFIHFVPLVVTIAILLRYRAGKKIDA